MQYTWRLEELARLIAHKHYLEDTLEEVIEQKDIAVFWLREKLKAVGPMQVYKDNHVRYLTEDGEEHVFYWNVTTREGQEFEQFVTPIKRYGWVAGEWRRTEKLIEEWKEKVNENED